MDGSGTYAKMCEEAEEIQKQRPPTFIATSSIFVYTLDGNCWYNADKGRFIWLPKQDQLQEMLETGHLTNPYNLVSYLWNALNEDKSCPEESPCEECVKESMYWRGFKTMERLWLAFVMREKYLKTWRDGEWVVK